MRAPTTKTRWFGALVVLSIFMLTSSVTLAEDGDGAEDQMEVLTSLEQRMQKRISVSFVEEPIDGVIRIIADQADVDIIKSPTVVGNVTATLTEVPLKEALDNILAAHGYGFVTDKNMIRVAPIADLSMQAEAMVHKIYHITYASVTEIEKALLKFKSPKGMVSSNPGTSHLIVTDTESQIKAIDTFIKEIDQVTPQIMIEARIYDITDTDRLDLGIEWQAGRDTTYTGGITADGTNPAGAVHPFSTGIWQSDSRETDDAIGALRFGFLNTHVDIDMILHAQNEVFAAKLLANPRILVLDNEAAIFDTVQELPYTESTVSAGGSTETIKWREVGVSLKVTPHLTRDGLLRLTIAPEFGVLVSQHPTTGAPTIDTRKLSTIAMVKDGATVVLGGLRKKEVSTRVNKIPLLGDIPLIGLLFRFESEDTKNVELVVFITPRIVQQPIPMDENEQTAYQETEFNGPEPEYSRKEKPRPWLFNFENDTEE
ncbi:MAG: secretin N-terminal domain-containing protein [Planctomycetota bacterium]|jgi:type IV pilus assembly protein PilQ